MGAVRGCEIPENLNYSVENNVWARQESDGTVTVGMTSYAASLAGQIVSYTPKKVGKNVKKDKSCATVESGKWVGPAKSPVSGDIVEVNAAVAGKPGLINEDPYGEGWLVKIQPEDWAADSSDLVSGGSAASAFEAKMASDGFEGCN